MSEALQLPSSTGSASPNELLMRRLADVLRENEQLRHALESRVVIEQAKGILAERHSLVPDQAFDLLRRGARSSGRRIHDLARDVVETSVTPVPVAAELMKRRRA